MARRLLGLALAVAPLLLLLLLLCPSPSAAWLDSLLLSSSSESTSPDYGSVLSSPFSPSSCSSSSAPPPPPPPGLTRSLVGLDFALVTPESRTWSAPVNSDDPKSAKNSWSNASVAHLVSPGRAGSGAAFSMFLVKLGAHGTMGPSPALGPSASAERFVFVLDGVVEVEVREAREEGGERSGGKEPPSSPRQRRRRRERERKRCSPQRKGGSGGPGGGGNFSLRADGFAFFPPHCSPAAVTTTVTAGPGGAGLVVFERVHVSRATGRASRPSFDDSDASDDDDDDDIETTLPSFVWGPAASKLPLLDPGHPETFKLRKLLPHAGPEASKLDFNVHLMDFDPGEFLVTKEIHHNQHGLLMLRGQGIYRLSNDVWAPVSVGDAIYMGPYVTQWFGSLGRERSRYLIFKDTAPDPLLAGGGGGLF